MYLKASDFRKAREDISRLRAMGGREERRYADELDAYCLIAEGQFVEAKRFIDENLSELRRISEVLKNWLAKAIAFSPAGLPSWLLEWAKTGRG